MKLRPRISSLPSRVASATAILALLLCVGNACAAPSIGSLSPRAAQLGGKTVLTFDGADLGAETRIVAPFPVLSQAVLPGAAGNRTQIELALTADLSPGIYEIRLANASGISAPIAIGVDELPPTPFSSECSLPAALYGDLTGPQILKTSFAGKKGDRVVCEVEARRIGSTLRPVVRLYDARGAQVAWSGPQFNLAGDARCQAELPADGQYSVELHDAVYRGAAPGFFRLKLGDLHYADAIFPLAAQSGAPLAFEFERTNLPVEARQGTLSPIDEPGAGQRPVSAAGIAWFTGTPGRVFISEHAEFVELPPANGQPQSLAAAPAGMSGRISSKGEEDRYLLDVQPGQRLRFEVRARRLGSPLDALLMIRNEAGAQLAAHDDRPDLADSMVDFTVPADVTKIVAAIKDLRGEGGEGFIYHLDVSDLSQPNFSLAYDEAAVNIPSGGSQTIQITANRSGYNGPIELSVDGLPDGVQASGGRIVAGDTIGQLTLTSASASAWQGVVKILGRGADESAMLTRIARRAETAVSKSQPWMRESLGVATLAQPADLILSWSPNQSDTALLSGGRFPIKAQFARAAGNVERVRLRLLTTQVTPKKTEKQNNVDVQVDDLERTLRLDGAPEYGPETAEAEIEVLVPADLPEKEWGLVLAADMLAADGKTVRTSVTSPTVYLPSKRSLALEIAGAPQVEAKAGGGETGQLAGKLIRMPGFTQPVTLTLVGLPAEYPAPTLELAADQVDFTLPIRFPYGAPAADLANVRLKASGLQTPGEEKSRLSSNEIPIAIKVVAGEKTE